MKEISLEKKSEILSKIMTMASRNYKKEVKAKESLKAEDLLKNLNNI